MTNSPLNISSGESSETTAIIKAHGNVKISIGVLWFVGVICVILALGGIIAFIFTPDSAKDLWLIIGPIISSAIVGSITYLSGENKKNS